MTSPRTAIGVGVLFGIVGAAGQIWLMQFGVVASAPLRASMTAVLAVFIGILAARVGKGEGVKAASLAGVVAGVMFSLVGLSALLMDPAAAGINPMESAEAFLTFASAMMLGTACSSWLVSGLAAFVAWPLSLQEALEKER